MNVECLSAAAAVAAVCFTSKSHSVGKYPNMGPTSLQFPPRLRHHPLPPFLPLLAFGSLQNTPRSRLQRRPFSFHPPCSTTATPPPLSPSNIIIISRHLPSLIFCNDLNMYAFGAKECALLLALFIDGELVASAAGPQLVAEFEARVSSSSNSSTSQHQVMLFVVQSGSPAPFAFPPIIKTINLRQRATPSANTEVRGADGRRALHSGSDAKYVTFQATFGQFNNKRVSLMNASMLCSSSSSSLRTI
jgi:hypothetical protein